MTKDGQSRSWGNLSAKDTDVLLWEFDTENFPVIGLYGHMSEDPAIKKIFEIGFYILDVECANTLPEEEVDREFSITGDRQAGLVEDEEVTRFD